MCCAGFYRSSQFQFDPLAIAGQRFSRVNITVIRLARGATLLGSIDLEKLDLEKVFEFYNEMMRRTDMIRFGKWEDTWTDKTSSNPIRRVYPISQDVIDAASASPGYLEQNRGY